MFSCILIYSIWNVKVSLQTSKQRWTKWTSKVRNILNLKRIQFASEYCPQLDTTIGCHMLEEPRCPHLWCNMRGYPSLFYYFQLVKLIISSCSLCGISTHKLLDKSIRKSVTITVIEKYIYYNYEDQIRKQVSYWYSVTFTNWSTIYLLPTKKVKCL